MFDGYARMMTYFMLFVLALGIGLGWLFFVVLPWVWRHLHFGWA